jgi:hypothetical protein
MVASKSNADAYSHAVENTIGASLLSYPSPLVSEGKRECLIDVVPALVSGFAGPSTGSGDNSSALYCLMTLS